MRAKEVLGRLLLVIGSLVIVLLAAEGVARRLVKPTHLVRFEETSQRVLQKQFTTIMESDPERFWKLAPGISLAEDARPFFGTLSNQAGLREDHEIPFQKPADELRILFLGDSCTFGYGLEYEDSFVEITETLLQRQFPDNHVECINAGVPGYTLFQGWRYYVTEGHRYQADVVVLNFGMNDLGVWEGRGEFERYEHWKNSQPPAFLRWSRLASVVADRLADKLPPIDPASQRPRVTQQEYRSLLERMAASIRQESGLLLLIGGTRLNFDPQRPPGVRSPTQEEGRRFARILAADSPELGGGIDGVAIVEQLLEQHAIDELFFDDVHPKRLLNQATAQQLSMRLAAWFSHQQED